MTMNDFLSVLLKVFFVILLLASALTKETYMAVGAIALWLYSKD